MSFDYFLFFLIPSCIGIISFSSNWYSSNNNAYSNFFLSNVGSQLQEGTRGSFQVSNPYSDYFQTLTVLLSHNNPYLTQVFQTSGNNYHVSNPYSDYFQTLTVLLSHNNPYLTQLFQTSGNNYHVSKLYTISSTFIPTVYPTQMPTIYPTKMPTQMPTVYPTKMPTQMPTVYPTKMPTQMPTIFIPVLSFETTMSLSGLSEPVLDDSSKTAVVLATAKSANISNTFVVFLNQHIVDKVYLKNKISLENTYDIDATTQMNIPMQGIYAFIAQDTLFTLVTNNIVKSVENGDFNMFLMSASIAINSTSTQHAVSKGVVFILSNPGPTESPSSNPTESPSSNPTESPSSNPTEIHIHHKPNTASILEITFIIIMACVVFIFALSAFLKARKSNHIILDIESI